MRPKVPEQSDLNRLHEKQTARPPQNYHNSETHSTLAKAPTTHTTPVEDPELDQGGGGGFVLLAVPAFLPSVVSSSFSQSKGSRPLS